MLEMLANSTKVEQEHSFDDGSENAARVKVVA